MTMNPFAGPQSPRTQGFAQGGPQGAVSVEDAFTDGFTQMAYDAMQKSNPSMMKDVVTFRVLDADPDEGSGLGTFILVVNQEVFYVPTVVAENTVKPIDMFYSRRLNRYFPLTEDWIVEANKSALNEMGHGVDTPKHVQNDVNITRIVEPPVQGRYGYAAAKTAAEKRAWAHSKVAADVSKGLHDKNVTMAFKWAATYERSAKKASVLPELLSSMPNAVKVAFARTLRAEPRLLRKMASLYGVNTVTSALQLREEKVASALDRPMKKDVFVATASTPLADMKKEFGEDTPKAYSSTRMFGFYAKDRRAKSDGVYAVEDGALHLCQPKRSGVYKVYTTDGAVEDALILVEPKGRHTPSYLFDCGPHQGRKGDGNKPGVTIVFKDGRCIQNMCSNLVAEPILTADTTEFRKMLEEWTTAAPAVGDTGLFVYVGRSAPTTPSTFPCKIKASRSSGSETRYDTEYRPTFIVSHNLVGAKTAVSQDGNLIVLTGDFRWLRVKPEYTSAAQIYSSVEDVLRARERVTSQAGSKKIAVKQASQGLFYIGTDPKAVPLARAVEKVASEYGISLPATVQVIYGAVTSPKTAYWVKRAAGEPPPGDPGQDPNAMPMDPSMMAPPAPPPPSGYELAIAEQLQLIQSQIAALNDKAMTLSSLQMRQQQIDGGGGPMAAPTGAASLMAGPPQGPMGGMPMAPPNAQPGMDPSMMQQGGQMPPQGGQPPMPQQGGQMPPQGAPPPPMGAQPPMDPSMAGQPPMDPSMVQNPQQPPPVDPNDPSVMRPSMTTRDIDAGTIQQSINPAFLNMAGELDQADVFDAAAIASLAQNKNIRSVVQSHLPRAEETLDNLGRMKLLFDLREGKIKSSLGNETYNDLAQTLRDVFGQLGDLLLKLNQNSDQLSPATIG